MIKEFTHKHNAKAAQWDGTEKGVGILREMERECGEAAGIIYTQDSNSLSAAILPGGYYVDIEPGEWLVHVPATGYAVMTNEELTEYLKEAKAK